MGHTLTASDLQEDAAVDIAGRLWQWFVAIEPQGTSVGVAFLARYPSEPAGRFHGYVIVDPAWRRRGVGTQLLTHLHGQMQSYGAMEWHSRVKEGDPAGMAFAQKQAFTVDFHFFESALELATFDESPYAGLIESLEAAGIRFITFDTVSDNPDAQRKLYELNRLAGLDEPTTDSFASFDTWKKIVLNSSWFHHDGEFVALDGERYVGLAGSFPTDDPTVYENGFTGVDPAYRGRKIAQALKILCIRHAQSRKARQIFTYNDSRNAAMLAINRKLGYVSRPGHYGLIKHI